MTSGLWFRQLRGHGWDRGQGTPLHQLDEWAGGGAGYLISYGGPRIYLILIRTHNQIKLFKSWSCHKYECFYCFTLYPLYINEYCTKCQDQACSQSSDVSGELTQFSRVLELDLTKPCALRLIVNLSPIKCMKVFNSKLLIKAAHCMTWYHIYLHNPSR